MIRGDGIPEWVFRDQACSFAASPCGEAAFFVPGLLNSRKEKKANEVE